MNQAQRVLEQFRRDYIKYGEQEALEKAAPWLERYSYEMAALEEADAYALLWAYYWWQGDEDQAWEWRDKAILSSSPLIHLMIIDEAETEIGEDDWDGEFEAYDDETEAGG